MIGLDSPNPVTVKTAAPAPHEVINFPAGAVAAVLDESNAYIGYLANFINGGRAGYIFGYHVDAATGSLTAVPGSPYRLLNAQSLVDVAMHPTNRYVVATTRLPPLLAVFARDAATGSLEHVPGSPFTPSVGTTPLGVTFDASGGFAYVTDETSFSVSAYAFDSTNGHLAFIDSYPLGATPVSAARIVGAR